MMTTTRALTLSAALFWSAVLCCAGCAGTIEGGTPVTSGASSSPTSGSSTPATGSGVSAGAPKVSHPVDVSRFKDQPCELLSSSQRMTLGITATPQTENNPGSGIICQMLGGADRPSVSIGVLRNPHGLSDLYRKKEQFDEFGPLPPINGFPAVKSLFANTGPGDCGYSVGLNDNTAVLILVSHAKSDSCNAVLQVARDVTITVKGES